MTQNWYKTNIDLSGIFRDGWEFPIVDKKSVWQLPYEKILNDDWVGMMNEKGINIFQVMLFYKPSYFSTNLAHIDLSTDDDISSDVFGFNWVIGGEGSKMVWYDKPNMKNEKKFTKDNISVYLFSIDKLKEIDRLELDTSSITMVRVDIPHTIIMGSQPRWCLSFRTNYRFTSWESAVDYMKSINLLTE